MTRASATLQEALTEIASLKDRLTAQETAQ